MKQKITAIFHILIFIYILKEKKLSNAFERKMKVEISFHYGFPIDYSLPDV